MKERKSKNNVEDDFDAKLAALKEKYKEFLTEDMIKHYCSKYRLGREDAIFKLCVNFEKESDSIDARQVALNAMKGVRLMSPKLAGLESREQDTLLEVRDLKSKNELIFHRIDGLEALVEHLTPPKGFWNKVKWIFKRN